MSEELENTVEEIQDDINADIQNAINEISGTEKTEEPEAAEPEKVEEKQPELPAIEPPAAWKAEDKEKFKSLPRDVQETIRAREDEVHKGFTKLDEDRNLGKQIKDVVTPYMAIIQAEGGTPVTAVKDLLNTAYMLRTAQPMQKAQIVKQICQTYGVDMNAVVGQQSAQPASYEAAALQQMQAELQQLRQMANPEYMHRALQEKIEDAKMVEEVRAFASNPENAYFEQLRPVIKGLLEGGVTSDLKKAYEIACYSDPQIRSTMEAKKMAEIEAKKKEELAAKKKAASSISGSSGTFKPNSSKNTNSIDDDVADAMRSLGYIT